MSEVKFRILGICGSLRTNSYNQALLRTARAAMPEKTELSIYQGLGDLPLYNDDLAEAGEPEAVHQLKSAIRECHALLIATPEYNYGVPGPLKNAIDWVSTPPKESPLRGKPIGVMGASGGGFGTVRAQLSLRQIFLFTESYVMPQPEFHISYAKRLFDEEYTLTDQATQERLRHFLLSLILWSRKMLVTR